jgi:hypothetical protein
MSDDGGKVSINLQVMGAWLSVLPSPVSGRVLSARESQRASCVRHDKCDACDAHFSLQHALACKKGGLVIFRQGEIRDELASLASRAFTPSAVRNEPLMHDGANEHMRTLPNKVTNHDADKEAATGEDERGDFLIRGFWTAGTDCILDVRVTDRDAKSRSKRWSRRKKRRNTHFPQNHTVCLSFFLQPRPAWLVSRAKDVDH